MSAAAASARSPSKFQDDAELIPAILRVLTYADQFGQAVSLANIQRFLDMAADSDCIESTVRYQTGDAWLGSGDYFCLPGREGLFAQTAERAERAKHAWPLARRWAAVMAHVPCVRMIAITGSLAIDNFGPGADIDFLVVTTPGRVWTARLLLVGLVRLARLSGVELCPNFVLSTKELRLHQQNLVMARELAQMVPLFGQGLYRQMIDANSWMFQYLPRATEPPPQTMELRLSPVARPIKMLAERLCGTALGQRLEDWERTRKIARLRRLPGSDTPDVILSPEQCKGHFRAAGSGAWPPGINEA